MPAFLGGAWEAIQSNPGMSHTERGKSTLKTDNTTHTQNFFTHESQIKKTYRKLTTQNLGVILQSPNPQSHTL